MLTNMRHLALPPSESERSMVSGTEQKVSPCMIVVLANAPRRWAPSVGYQKRPTPTFGHTIPIFAAASSETHMLPSTELFLPSQCERENTVSEMTGASMVWRELLDRVLISLYNGTGALSGSMPLLAQN